MRRYGLIFLCLALSGCGDSGTASLEREVDRLQREVARLQAENAELRERANALSLDLEHQRFINNELRAKASAAQTPAPSAQPIAEKAAEPVTPIEIAPKPESKPTTETAASAFAPAPTPAAARPAMVKPPTLPDIKPRSAVAQKPATAAERDEERGYKPVPSQDPFAAFKKPEASTPTAAHSEKPPASEMSEKRESAPKTVAPVQTASTPASRSSGASGLQLVDVKASHVGDALHITGQVVNNTRKPVLRVRIRGVFLDEASRVVASNYYSVEEGSRLKPGERASFEIVSPSNPAISRWRLSPLGEQETP